MRYAFLIAIPFAMLAARPATAQAPAVINVHMANFKFTPNTIFLDHGHPYVLRLQNAAEGGHNFTAAEFFAAADVSAEDRRLVTKGAVEVPAGQVLEIHLTAPAAAGSYNLKCSHAFHKAFGMSGKILVR